MKQVRPFIISSTITAFVMTTLSFFIEDSSESRSTLAVGLIVAVVILAIPIYSIERWSLLKRSLVHFAVMAVTVLPITLWSGWFSPTVSIIVFLLFGLAGWLIGVIINKIHHKAS